MIEIVALPNPHFEAKSNFQLSSIILSRMLQKTRYFFLVLPALFLLIYFQIFYADFAYLDDIYQLWHNNSNANFIMFHSQGRWLSGLLFQNLFSSISSVAQLKWLRVFSLVGWMLTTAVFAIIFRKWVQRLNLSSMTWWLSAVYVVCSISV